MRLHAFITIQPFLAKGRKLTPEKLLPFPWDNKKTAARAEAPELTAGERRRRFEEVAQRLGDDKGG